MARGEVGKIRVSVETRLNKLEAGLRQAEKRVEKSASRMAESGRKAGAAFTDKLAKGFAMLAGIESAAKAVTAVSQAMRGDMEALDQTLRSIPAGIGPVIGALIDMHDELSGKNALEQFQEKEKKRNEILDKRIDILKKIRHETNLIGKEGAEKARLQVNQKADEQINQIDSQGLLTDQIQKAINNRRQAELAAIDQLEQEKTQKMVEAERDRQKEIKQEKEREMQDRIQVQKAMAERLLDLDARIAAARLRQQGRESDARIKTIKAGFEREIRAAETAQEKAKLKKLRDLEVASARQSERPKFGIEQVALSLSTLGGGKAPPVQEKPVEVKGQNEVIEQLKLIAAQLTGGVPARVTNG